MRLELGEAYRTLLGHFRHEIGHYYWDRLVDGAALRSTPFRDAVRRRARVLRGRGRARTTETARPRTGRRASSARTRRCTPGRTGPRAGRTTCTWSTRWRPRAASASRCGRAGRRRRDRSSTSRRARRLRRLRRSDGAWVPLTVALNSLNRSMGLPDPYPFVLAAPALEKIASFTR